MHTYKHARVHKYPSLGWDGACGTQDAQKNSNKRKTKENSRNLSKGLLICHMIFHYIDKSGFLLISHPTNHYCKEKKEIFKDGNIS